jgi:hypothetical protein
MIAIEQTTSIQVQPGAPCLPQDSVAANDDPRVLVHLYQQRLRSALLIEATAIRPTRGQRALAACRRAVALVEQRFGSAVSVGMAASA